LSRSKFAGIFFVSQLQKTRSVEKAEIRDFHGNVGAHTSAAALPFLASLYLCGVLPGLPGTVIFDVSAGKERLDFRQITGGAYRYCVWLVFRKGRAFFLK
ncbi:MAG: hypothetical protein LBS18_04575, partial [Clostridiales bacterium]|nr:hypothetical protein [Clostridiales bacterium]